MLAEEESFGSKLSPDGLPPKDFFMKGNYQKQNIPFTQVANDILNEASVSLSAKGMFAYLFSKPEGWQFSSERIINDHSDGKRAVLSALKELETAGYLTRQRLASGRVLYFMKHGQSAETALGVTEPKVQKTHSAETHSAESAPVSNKEGDSNKENIKKDSAILFEDFWKEYPRKTAKHLALKKWLSMRPSAELTATIIAAVELHKKTRQWQESSRFIPHAATFLNQRRWEDEVEEQKIIGKKTIHL